MDKAQEIEILRAAASQLGTDSYCGPWLNRIIPRVEMDIRSDLTPDPMSLSEFTDAVIAAAKAEAEQILRDARKDAQKMLAEAERTLADAQASRDRIAIAAAEAKRTIDAVVANQYRLR